MYILIPLRDIRILSRLEFSEVNRKQSRISNFGKLYLYLVETFGYPRKTQKKVGKREGQDVQLNLLAFKNKLNETGAITVTLSKTKLNITLGGSDSAKATINFRMKEDKIIPIVCDIIRTKANIWGLAKVSFKYIIPGKIRFKGSIFAAIRAVLLMMLGKHPMYKKSKVNPHFLKKLK